MEDRRLGVMQEIAAEMRPIYSHTERAGQGIMWKVSMVIGVTQVLVYM